MIRVARSAKYDSGLLIAVLAMLLLIGLPAILSATHFSDGGAKVLKQFVWVIPGIGLMFVVARIDYRGWMRYSALFYGITLLALLLVLFTRKINGASSWFAFGPVSIQPSEFAKVALILFFAALFSRLGPRFQTLPFFARALLLIGVPVLMILAQPDFGSAMVVCAIWFVMALTAGARWWMLAGLVLSSVLLFAFAWKTNLIKPYQKQRLDFIHANPAEQGYHQRQAIISIGSGGLFGKGYLRGTQAGRNFLPEKETDFIFAVIGEELGLLGCLSILALYAFILWRIIRIAEEAETPMGRTIAIGVAALIAVHVFINIGMNLKLSPVTGVPLPLISYGGSNLLANLLAIGLVLNVSKHRQSSRTWAAEHELVQI